MNTSPCLIEGCDREGSTGRGLCSMHYGRWRRYGDPTQLPAHPMRERRSNLKKLWQAVKSESDDCFLIQTNGGRTTVTLAGISMQASRAAWILKNGDPGNLLVLHRCNGGSGALGCANPRHLYLGTQSDNMVDLVESDHPSSISRKGERNLSALLTKEAVEDIRATYVKRVYWPDPRSCRSLALKYGVGQKTIRDAANGITWSHVDGVGHQLSR